MLRLFRYCEELCLSRHSLYRKEEENQLSEELKFVDLESI